MNLIGKESVKDMTEIKKIRVLHIISGYGGGISSHIRNLAKGINGNKISFDVIGFTDYSDEFIEEIAAIHGKTFTFLKPKKVGFIKFYRHALGIIRSNGHYDAIQCHISGHYSLIFKIMAMQAGVKRFIVHAHRTTYDKKKSWLDGVQLRIDRFISNFSATQLTSCSSEASEFVFGRNKINNKVMHIPNSIPLEKYAIDLSEEEKAKIKIEIGIQNNKLVIGNLGRFTLVKNHAFMVDIMEYMVKQGVDFIWLFVGDGALEVEIKKMVQERGLSDYAQFLGRREDANYLYQIMDVFVMTSFSEGLPTTIVETQAAGVPAVITDTITKEVDFGLNMVTYLSLTAGLSIWMNAIIQSSKSNIPDIQVRKDTINAKGFSNEVAAKLYEDFLTGKIDAFRLGENYPK